VIADLDTRRAILCGPTAVAKLRAQRAQTTRLAAAAREQDQKVTAAIRKANRP
jgi:hypothetical protein